MCLYCRFVVYVLSCLFVLLCFSLLFPLTPQTEQLPHPEPDSPGSLSSLESLPVCVHMGSFSTIVWSLCHNITSLDNCVGIYMLLELNSVLQLK